MRNIVSSFKTKKINKEFALQTSLRWNSETFTDIYRTLVLDIFRL